MPALNAGMTHFSEKDRCPLEQKSFADLALSPEMLHAVQDMGYEEATPIQAESIPHILDGQDILGQAQTGTGKTCAFGIPIIERVDLEDEHIQYLVLSPTRELAIQIADAMHELTKYKEGIRVLCVYGGQPIERQLDQLRKRPQIVVATPGRLIDHVQRRTIRLDTVHTAILDEADRMLDMGFIHDVRGILDLMPKVSQIAMFSATLSRSVMDISWIYQRDVVELTVDDDLENKPDIVQYAIEASGQGRISAFLRLVNEKQYKKVMIFCNTKHTVKSVTRQLSGVGCKADCIHGDMNQNIRERVIDQFRKGTLQILVATDIASRGLDIDQVEAVINYDIPNENEYYIHRIGRTGRAKRAGVSYTFTSLLNRSRLDEIARYTRTPIIELVI